MLVRKTIAMDIHELDKNARDLRVLIGSLVLILLVPLGFLFTMTILDDSAKEHSTLTESHESTATEDILTEIVATMEGEGTPLGTPAGEVTTEATVEGEVTTEATLEATVEATTEPTLEPTVEATTEPTVEATIEPTVEPTIEPTATDAIF